MENEIRCKWPENLPVIWQESTWQPRVIVRPPARLAGNGDGFILVRMGIMGRATRPGTHPFSSDTQPRINL